MPPVEPATQPPARHADPQRPPVALCEPDALLRALLGEWLVRAGFEPVRCATAAPLDNVVLVVADVTAPRQDGGSCIGALRRSFPQAKVLAISAQFVPGMHGTTIAGLSLGADAVLAKPFGAKVFIDTARALLGS